MPERSHPLFPVAQRLVLSLYDGGVLSPAVLERVIASIGDKGWNTKPDAVSSDGRSLRDVIVSVMMPGNSLDNVDQDFTAIITHIVSAAGQTAAQTQHATGRAGRKSARASAAPAEEDGADESALIAQLSGGHGTAGKRTKAARGDPKGRQVSTFNPLFNAAIPKK